MTRELGYLEVDDADGEILYDGGLTKYLYS